MLEDPSQSAVGDASQEAADVQLGPCHVVTRYTAEHFFHHVFLSMTQIA